jgi:hypothetical protein
VYDTSVPIEHEWYAHGDCGLLAFTISEITGWPVMFSPDWPCALAGCAKRHPGGPHMLVRHPTGKLLDIDGLHEPTMTQPTIYEYDDEIKVPTGFLGLSVVRLAAWRADRVSFYDLTEEKIHMDAMNVIARSFMGASA